MDVGGLCAAVAGTTGEVFKGAGVPRYVTVYAVLYNLILGGALVVFGRTHGLEGIAWATVLAPLGVASLALRRVAIVLDIRLSAILKLLVTPIQGTMVMVVVVLSTSRLLSLLEAGPVLRLVVEVGHPVGTGHPIHHPSGEYIITDAYPKETPLLSVPASVQGGLPLRPGQVPLRLIEVATQREVWLAVVSVALCLPS